jgi:ABC-2 type transport system permease protein
MSRILNIARKDILLRFASPIELLFFLILPVIFSVIVGGFASGPSTGDNRIVVLVVNQDGGGVSNDLVQALEASGSIRPEVLVADAAAQAFDDGDSPALLTIPAGFETALRAGQSATLPLQLTPSNANSLAAQQGIQAAAAQVSRELAAASGSVSAAEQVRAFTTSADRTAYFDASLNAAQALFADAPQRISTVEAVQDQNETYSGAAQGAAGQLIVWVFIPLLGTSALMAYERATGTLRRLLSTPTPKSGYLLGTIAGQYSVGILQMLILVGFGALILKVDWGPPGALLAVLLAFGLAGVAMGTTMGTFVKTESQANGLSVMLGMVFGLLGGCMWPLELFPPTLQKAVHILPTTWAMQALTDLTMRGEGFLAVLPEIGVLLGFAVVFFIAGVMRFRYE